MEFEAVTINGLTLCIFEKSGIAKVLALMPNQLNLKFTASKVQAWTIDVYERKIIETK